MFACLFGCLVVLFVWFVLFLCFAVVGFVCVVLFCVVLN